MDITSLCLIPERLLVNIRKRTNLAALFEHVDDENFIWMMSHTICQLMESKLQLPSGHKKITLLQSQEWLSCFEETLNEMDLSDDVRQTLLKNMTKLSRKLMQKSYTNLCELVCEELTEKVGNSADPEDLLLCIKDVLKNHN